MKDCILTVNQFLVENAIKGNSNTVSMKSHVSLNWYDIMEGNQF